MSARSKLAPIDFRGSDAALHGHKTYVDLIWIEKRHEHWLRFGQHIDDRIIDRKRRTLLFKPDSIFAFVRWAANDYGTVSSRIDIVRCVRHGEAYTTLAGVRPGGDLLLHIHGWPKVNQVLQAIDAIEALGLNPCEVSPDHWRHVHNRLTVGDQPRRYTLPQHQAWALRRRVQS